MGMLSKIKSILFDEDVVEIPVRTDELPEKEDKISRNKGFIDYSQDPDIEIENTFIDEEEDTITQLVLPKEEEEEEVKEEVIKVEATRESKFPMDVYDEMPSRSKAKFTPDEVNEVKKEATPRRDYASLIKTEHKVEKREEKDYKKYLNDNNDNMEKKPFKVTPVISPVYGVIKETEAMQEELITIPVKKSVDDGRPRMFGPVSFNDNPLPTKKVVTKKEEVIPKQEDVEKKKITERVAELDRNINKFISEPIEKEVIAPKIESKIEEEIEESYEDYVDTRKIPKITEEEVEEVITTAPEDENEEMEIVSPNYDDLDAIETSGIEEEYLNAPDIEEEEVEEEVIPTEEIINKVQNEEDEDAHLDDTIETDLFNLIDSMYKDNDEDEIEED